MRLAVLLFIPALSSAELPKLQEPFRSLADLAATAPPEFSADALLRMVESGKLADRNVRRDLVEQAFGLAASAKFPVRMEALAGTGEDTLAGSRNHAYGLKLDTLSLQSRAVRDMLALDPAKARELFAQVVRPALSPLTCDDALVYEPSELYQTSVAVVNGAFTPKEKSKDEHIDFLLDSLGQATSASELAPLAKAIQGAAVTAVQHQVLWARFNGLLDSIQPDDRSFGASLPGLSTLGLPEMEASLEKYRKKSQGCQSDAASSKNSAGNQKKPSTPKLEEYWQSTNTQQLLHAGRKLRLNSNGQQLTEADRSTAEWQQQLGDYLNLIAGWTPDQEDSAAVYYHEKCLVYTALIELVLVGPQNDKILADYVDFISNSGLYQQSPVEWFVEPHMLLDRFRGNPQQRLKVLEAYQRSGNPVLVLEVSVERLLR